MRRFAIACAFLAVALAGCGEAGPLDGLGDRTREAVKGETTTTTVLVAVAAGGENEGLVKSDEVLWFNDDISPQYTGTSQEVIKAVWQRELGSRFVQAARAEIATALPSAVFPGFVPQQVLWITSQLTYDEISGTLDSDTSAAFGLWSDVPYQSDTARIGVLRVGRAPLEAPAVRSQITSIEVPDGVSLGWTESGHRYELFCRAEVSEDLCTSVSLSAVPMRELLP
ncbi:MAG: hypothetical protein ACR2NG_00480 [Acidimicrobiia bacterium]